MLCNHRFVFKLHGAVDMHVCAIKFTLKFTIALAARFCLFIDHLGIKCGRDHL